MKISSLALCLLLPLSTWAAPQTWTIGNDTIERTISFGPDGLSTVRLFDLQTHSDFVPQPNPKAAKPQKNSSPEFSFNCNGHSYTAHSSDFDFVNAEQSALSNGKSLTITLQAKELPLAVSVLYKVYNGHPAIRKSLVLRNTGSSLLRISHLAIENVTLTVGKPSEVTLNTQYGTIPRETFYTGRSEDAGLLIANGRTGVGFAIVSEVPGYMKRTEIDAWYRSGVSVRAMYDTDLMPFARSLSAGQQFETAGVSVVTFQNGDGFHDPHWVLPSYTAKVLMRRIDARGAPWIYNTWEPFNRKVNRDLVLKLMDAASSMNMDIFTIDDGWQKEYGENKVDLKAFPGGLKSIQSTVESKGMRLGLWIPLAAIGTSTAGFKNHQDWGALDMEQKQKLTGTAAGEKAVMCLASPFRDSAAERVNQAIDEFHLAYVKLDLTTIFNAYGEAPGCWAKNHDHRDWAESLGMIYEGIAQVTRAVYAKHPDVLLDLTFELWGQKHIIDAGLLAAGDLDWMSNVDDNRKDSAGPLQARTLLYQRAASMPVESMLIGNIHGELPTIQESFATEIGSAPVLLGDLRNLTASDRQWYHEKISWFKDLRSRVRLSESFFPLGSWLQPSPAKWDGFARLDHTGKGVLTLFRNQSDVTSAMVELPLLPAGSFRLHSVITNRDIGTFTKADFSRGVSIPFTGANPVEILEVITTQK